MMEDSLNMNKTLKFKVIQKVMERNKKAASTVDTVLSP